MKWLSLWKARLEISKGFYAVVVANGELPKRLPVLVNIGLVAALVYSLIQLLGFALKQTDVLLLDTSSTVTPTSVADSEVLDVGSIISLNLFGQASAPRHQGTAQEVPEAWPELLLRGVVHSENLAAARAIIAQPGGRDIAYGVGAQLPDGIQLAEIHRDRVFLSQHGRLQVLYLKEKQHIEE